MKDFIIERQEPEFDARVAQKHLNVHGFDVSSIKLLDDFSSGRLLGAEKVDVQTWTSGLLNKGVVNDVDGLVHVVANHVSYGNLPGQISASGPNTQAIPKFVRPYLRWPEGRMLYAFDIGSAESRFLVAVTGDEKLTDAIQVGLYDYVGDKVSNVTGITLTRPLTKRLTMGYFYGQTAVGSRLMLKDSGIVETVGEATNVFNAMQNLFPKTTEFLNGVSQKDVAFLQGRWTDVDVSDKKPQQRRSYVASSGVAAIVKRWSLNLLDTLPTVWIHEIPRDALWVSVPVNTSESELYRKARDALVLAVKQLGFESFPVYDDKLLTMKEIGTKL